MYCLPKTQHFKTIALTTNIVKMIENLEEFQFKKLKIYFTFE